MIEKLCKLITNNMILVEIEVQLTNCKFTSLWLVEIKSLSFEDLWRSEEVYKQDTTKTPSGGRRGYYIFINN